MLGHRALFIFLIGLIIHILMWQLYILEPILITEKADFFHYTFRAQRQYQHQQKEQQQEKKSDSFLSSDSKVNISSKNIVSGSHLLPQIGGSNELITKHMKANNKTNYFTNSSLENSKSNQLQPQHQYQQPQNQSVSFSPPASTYLFGENGVSGSHHLSQFSDPDEPITITSTNAINNTNNFTNISLTNSNYNLSLVSYPFSAVNYEALPKDDISTLIDLHDFEFIINQKSCREASLLSSSSSSPDINNVSTSSLNFNTETVTNRSFSKQNTDPGSPLLLILVVSAPQNHKKRLLIRETWGSLANTTNNIRLLFLLAAVNKIEDERSLEDENRIYSDIVQGNFHDHYRNMTYKHVMALKWFTYYCPNAKYVLKTDDDAFVNTPNLVDFLTNHAARHDLLFCRKLSKVRVIRKGSKWSPSRKEYAGDYYPPFCPGYAILYSPDAAFRLYLEAQKTRYFWIDDVHVTGTLAQQANITITSFKSRLLDKQKGVKILAGQTNISTVNFLFAWPTISMKQIPELWKLLVANLPITKK